MKTGQISNRKIENLGLLAYKNALRLHEDAITLYNGGAFPSAYALSVLSLEEHGKVLWIEHFIFHHINDGERPLRDESKDLTYIFNHRFKQNEFARHNGWIPIFAKGVFKDLWNGEVERAKQKALYVGLPRIKGKIDLKGKISSPSQITKARAKRQITTVNDYIITRMASYLKGFSCVEIDKLGSQFSHHQIEYFRTLWTSMNAEKRREFETIMKYPDDEEL